MAPSIARLLITMDCVRNCTYCCNKYSRIMSRAKYINSLDEMDQHDVTCITGGEPQLEPGRIYRVIDWARKLEHKPKLFMYTTVYTKHTSDIAKMIDGIHYSIHAPMELSDLSNFNNFDWTVVRSLHHQKSFRLYIESSVDMYLAFNPSRYQRTEIKHWQSEDELLAIQPNGIPAGETMYIWRE